MRFTVEFTTKYAAHLKLEGRHVATFEAIHSRQMSTVTLFELSSSPEERLAALRLAAYQLTATSELSIFGSALTRQIESGTYTPDDFPGMLDTTRLPEHITSRSYRELLDMMNFYGGPPVVEAVHPDFRSALDHALSVPPLTGIVEYEVVREPDILYDDVAFVRFTVEAPKKFTFWNDLSRAGDLHVIPSYHPAMQNRHHSILLNGDTNACIHSEAIQAVYAPPESRSADADKRDWSSWTKMEHPVKAEGQSFEAKISKSHVLSDKGVNTVVELLTAALGLDRFYVGVSGGFNSPYDRPAYVARERNIRLTTREREARGSEDHCAWTYYTLLREEGHLRDSYVPEWFYTEDWLKAYPPLNADKPSR